MSEQMIEIAEHTCPSLSYESRRPCVLPDTREAHLGGHESARVDIVRAIWPTSQDDHERWAQRVSPPE